MIRTLYYFFRFSFFLLFLGALFAYPVCGQNTGDTFTLVIDPGHGGKDPGTVGTRRYKTYEKDVVLDVALRFGALVEKNMPDVNIVYTRDKDVFIELGERSRIANKVKADLFISIHCNAVEKNGEYVKGASTYVMGLHKSETNMAVARRENSVILLEDDYKEKYDGFDPNDPESIIAMSLLQNNHLGHSIECAKFLQQYFNSVGGRADKGVQQAGLYVLVYSGMPSVLVELGYLTNRSEEDFLHSSTGKQKMAEALFRSFQAYKNKFYTPSAPLASPKEEASRGITYKVQVCSSRSPVDVKKDPLLKKLDRVSFFTENGYYKYTSGNETSYRKILPILQQVKKRGIKDAFIIAFEGDKKISVDEARRKTGE